MESNRWDKFRKIVALKKKQALYEPTLKQKLYAKIAIVSHHANAIAGVSV
jgi:hypothetical protein